MADTENIEARLCAYVEGDLDDAGRAEIEAHLASNPQHRQLLAELQAQHALLAGLPRLSAPEDLSDAVQTQLERSVLLNDAMDRPAVAGRIHRWPQFFAAAAVVLLGLGLVAVIYMVLPAHRQPRGVAMNGPAATRPRAGGTVAEDRNVRSTGALGVATTAPSALARGEAEKAGGDSAYRRSHELAKAQGPGESSSLAMKEALPAAKIGVDKIAGGGVFASAAPIHGKAGAEGARDYGDLFANQTRLDEAGAQRLRALHGLTADAPVVVVASADPAAADQQVRRFLADNKIHWEPASEPMPAPVNFSQRQVVLPQRLQNRIEMHLKDSAASGASGAQQQAMAPGAPPAAVGGAIAAPTTQSALAAAPPVAEQQTPQPAIQNASIMPTGAATEPSEDQANESTIIGGQADASAANKQLPEFKTEPPAISQSSGAAEAPRPAATMPAPTLIIARGLTVQQVTALNENLASLNAGRVTELLSNEPAGPIAPAAPADSGNKAPVASAAPRVLNGKLAATTGPVSTVAKPAPAAPNSPPPTSMPALASRNLSAAPTTAPIASTQPASTQPAGASARMDVIILVRKVPAASPPIFEQRAASPAATTAPAAHMPATTAP